MSYCKKCNVYISTKSDFCPLCHRKIIKNENDNLQAVQTFPTYEEPLRKKINYSQLIVDILAPVGIFVTLLVNLLTFTGILWSIIDIVAIIYVWGLALWVFTKDVGIGVKIVLNAVGINLILITINLFGFNLATLPHELWSVTYALPAVILVCMLVNQVIHFSKKYGIRQFLISQFSLCCISIAVFVIALSGVTSMILPSFVLFSFALITLMVVSIFGGNMIVKELVKKFHV